MSKGIDCCPGNRTYSHVEQSPCQCSCPGASSLTGEHPAFCDGIAIPCGFNIELIRGHRAVLAAGIRRNNIVGRAVTDFYRRTGRLSHLEVAEGADAGSLDGGGQRR